MYNYFRKSIDITKYEKIKTLTQETQLSEKLYNFVNDYEKAPDIKANRHCTIDCIIYAYFILTADIDKTCSSELIQFKHRFKDLLSLVIVDKFNMSVVVLDYIFENRLIHYLDVFSAEANLNELFLQIILNRKLQ